MWDLIIIKWSKVLKKILCWFAAHPDRTWMETPTRLVNVPQCRHVPPWPCGRRCVGVKGQTCTRTRCRQCEDENNIPTVLQQLITPQRQYVALFFKDFNSGVCLVFSALCFFFFFLTEWCLCLKLSGKKRLDIHFFLN